VSSIPRATAIVDTGAIERNCARLRRDLADGTDLCAVVKADGYGHGAGQSARAAVAGGAAMLAVATGGEAKDLRDAGLDVPILTMGALSADELRLALEAGSEIAIWDPEFLGAVEERARELGARPRVHVKYDTGMGRLGERDPRRVTQLLDAVAASEEAELVALWTHFATADEPGSRYFDEQLNAFRKLADEVRAAHPDLRLHAANSAATVRARESHFDMVRCGIAIYGLDPFQEDAAARELEPAMSLRSYLGAVKRFEHGASAGYGQAWRAPADTYVGVVPVGYGDGVRRDLTNNARVLIGGRRFPVVGTVSMDNITVDLGPDTDAKVGDEVILIGAQGEDRIPAEEVARRLATINYEVVCGISPRVPREYPA
jgi:alanine racemase